MYTALIKQDGEWWIGRIHEIPGINCQESTREELVETLQATLKDFLDDELVATSSMFGDFERVPISI